MAEVAHQLHSLTDRPDFPKGLRVLLVSPLEKRADVVEHLKGLNYDVTAVQSMSEAFMKLDTPVEENFDIVLTEAWLFCEPKSLEQFTVMSAETRLPYVLMAEKETSMKVLMEMVELGAVEIIQKPLSKERLQNIWQHVVRKMLSVKGSSKELKPASADTETRLKGSAPCTPRTPSPTNSFATPSDSTEAKSMEQDMSMSGVAQRDQAAMSDSSSSGVSKRSGPPKAFLHACRPRGEVFGSSMGSPNEKGRCAKISVRPTTLGTPANGSLPVGPCGRAQWPGLMQANPQGGCVWGTPVPPSCMPYITSQAVIWDVPAASETTSSGQCQPLPMHEVDSTTESEPSPVVDLFPLVDEHAAFLVNEVLEGSDDERGAEKSSPSPPIGLKLRKSASLLDLINRSLQMCTPSTMCMH